MGAVWTRDYFPRGYEEWVEKAVTNTGADRATFIAESKESVETICRWYEDQRKAYAADANLWIKSMLADIAKQELPTTEQVTDHTEAVSAPTQAEAAVVPTEEEAVSTEENVVPTEEHAKMVYDMLVGAEVCLFWKQLANRTGPLDGLAEWYEENKPKIVETFHQMQVTYKVPWSPEPVIAHYEHYC